ncbi:MAG: PQQ-dependent sugar dehydrogenase [Phyllobacterium sp.]
MTRLVSVLAGLTASVAVALTPLHAEEYQADGLTVSTETIVEGLASPWALAFLPDGALLVTERGGTMRIIADGKKSAPIAGVPKVFARGQGGLLDVALAPDFPQSDLIYFTYSQPGDGGAGTAVARARLRREGNGGRLEDVKTIFSMNRKTSRGQHFGSRIVVAPDGKLFVTIGERGERDRAQDFSDHAGSVIRINADGTIPSDNPFVGTTGALPELWSKGHRNAQGAAWDPVTQSLWITEHGARGGDEVNRPEAGKNYGWPVITYGRDYSGAEIGTGTAAEGYEQPLHYWDPSIAPSGLAVYRGDMFPEWQGDLLAGALKYEMLVRLERDADGQITGEERLLKGAYGRIRDVRVAADGSVFLLTDDENGKIIRMSRHADE